MKVLGKSLIMVVVDGVDYEEVVQLKQGFEEEGALVLTTTPQRYITIMALQAEGTPRELVVDMPFEAIADQAFEGLILPEGVTSILDQEEVALKLVEIIKHFSQRPKFIFASGRAAELLYDEGLLSPFIVVRDGTSVGNFLERAISVLSESVPSGHVYRSTSLS